MARWGREGVQARSRGVEMRHGTALAVLSGEERRGKVGELLATYIERDRAKKKPQFFSSFRFRETKLRGSFPLVRW